MRRALLALVATFLVAPLAQAQSADHLYRFGQRTPLAGARMTALGGAAVAGLGDWTAVTANPAGLAYLRSNQAVIATEVYGQYDDRRGTPDDEVTGATLTALGGAMPLPVARGALAFGGGYQQTASYTRASEVTGRQPPQAERGWQGEISAAGAVALTPRLMAGLSVNAPVGQYESNAFGVRLLYDEAAIDADLYGVNARAGLSLALDYGVRLGLTVETPTYLRVEQGPNVRFNESVTITTPPSSFGLTTPWRVAAGFLAGGPRVLVTADVEVVDWSQARFDSDGRFALVRENEIADRFFRTVVNSRVGAEARMGAIALRIGAAFQPDPRFDGSTPEVVGQLYSVGVGMQVHPQARLDIAFAHTRHDRLYDRFSGAESIRNALHAGLDVRFGPR